MSKKILLTIIVVVTIVLIGSMIQISKRNTLLNCSESEKLSLVLTAYDELKEEQQASYFDYEYVVELNNNSGSVSRIVYYVGLETEKETVEFNYDSCKEDK